MKNIFVIGNIGTGKSSFCKMLYENLNNIEKNTFYINLDEYGHKVLNDENVKSDLIKKFGKFNTNKELANRAFKDKNTLNTLNSITHPKIKNFFFIDLAKFKASNIYDFLIVEQTAVKETNDEFLQKADYCICLTSNKTRSQTPNRLNLQPSFDILKTYCNEVVCNDGTLDALNKKAYNIALALKSRF